MWNLLKHDLKIHCKALREYSVLFMKLTAFYPESQTPKMYEHYRTDPPCGGQ
jgi:hypothetical protein